MKKYLVVIVLVVACSIISMGSITPEYKGKHAKRWSSLPNDDVIGDASWYGTAPFKGNRTPSGIICDGRTSQAAHKTLPFGLVVRVCNISGDLGEPMVGECVRVVITDRGPYVDGRIIDLNAKWTMNRLCGKSCGMATVIIEVEDDTYMCGSSEEPEKSFRCFSKMEYQYKGKTRTFGKYLEPHEIEILGLTKR